MIDQSSSTYRFEDFELDAHKRLLLRNGEPVQIPSKAFDLLLTLIESDGRALTKQELMESLWAIRSSMTLNPDRDHVAFAEGPG